MICMAMSMRVRDLDESGQQNKRNTQHPKPSGPGFVRALMKAENTHTSLTIEQKGPAGKAEPDN